MTRKHYIELAADFKQLREDYMYDRITPSREVVGIDLAIDRTASALARANTHFDKQRFLTACGR